MEKQVPHLAVLIDAENAQLAILAELLEEIAKIGTASVRRVYGDFTNQGLSSWRDPMLRIPCSQFNNSETR